MLGYLVGMLTTPMVAHLVSGDTLMREVLAMCGNCSRSLSCSAWFTTCPGAYGGLLGQYGHAGRRPLREGVRGVPARPVIQGNSRRSPEKPKRTATRTAALQAIMAGRLPDLRRGFVSRRLHSLGRAQANDADRGSSSGTGSLHFGSNSQSESTDGHASCAHVSCEGA